MLVYAAARENNESGAGHIAGKHTVALTATNIAIFPELLSL